MLHHIYCTNGNLLHCLHKKLPLHLFQTHDLSSIKDISLTVIHGAPNITGQMHFIQTQLTKE